LIGRQRILLLLALVLVAAATLAGFAALLHANAFDSNESLRAAVETGLFATAVTAASGAVGVLASLRLRALPAIGVGLASALPWGMAFYWLVTAADLGYCNT